MKNNFTLLLFLAIIPWLGHAQNYTFSQMASCPQATYTSATFTIGDTVYIISGAVGNLASAPKVLTNHVWAYNRVTDTWVQKNNFPGTAVYGASAFTIGQYGYVVNGWDSSGSGSGPNTLWQYDATNDSWTTKASFPGSTRYTCASFSLNGKGYISMGYKPLTNDMWEYDPGTDSWSQKAAFPGQPRQAPVWVTIGNYAYVGLGATDIPGGFYVNSDWYRYDPSTNTWATMSTFPGDPLTGSFSCVLNNEAYIIDGMTESNFSYSVGASNKVWKYSPTTNTWSLWGLFPDTAFIGGPSTTAGGAGYMGLGATNWITYPLSSKFYRFGPGTGNFSCNATITSLRVNNAERNFQASGNFSPSATLSWSFGDGSTGVGTSVFHSYTSSGTYNVLLVVQDTANGSCAYTATDTITVSNISNCSTSISYTNIGPNYTLYTNNAGGYGPYTYQWYSSDSSFASTSPDPLVHLQPNISNDYCVTVTDSTGCAASACTQIVYVPDTTNPTCQTMLYIYPDANVPGLYYAYIYHTGAPIVSYIWTFGDGGTSIDSLPNHTYITSGFYYICLTTIDTNNCTSYYCDSLFYAYKMGGGPMSHLVGTQQLPTSIGSIKDPLEVSVYPNPALSEITISLPAGKIDEITIYATDGRKMMQATYPEMNKLDIHKLPQGLYFIDIRSGEKSSRTRFVKAN